MKQKIDVIHVDGSITRELMEIVEPKPPVPPEPTRMDVLESQVTYTALKTGTMIPAPKKKEAAGNV